MSNRFITWTVVLAWLLPCGASAHDSNNKTLLELAEQRFGRKSLSSAERKLFANVPRGHIVNCGERRPPDDNDQWTTDQRIRAACLAWLLTDHQAREHITHAGLNIMGAGIHEVLDLRHVFANYPLAFTKCAFRDNIILREARLVRLSLEGCRTKSIDAEGMRVDGSVYLRRQFESYGEVRLIGATIDGRFDCRDSKFNNPGKKALNAEEANISRSVYLNGEFAAHGEVILLGAKIGGQLDCIGGTFDRRNGCALRADAIDIARGAYLKDGFNAVGEVRLLGAKIGKNFECTQGTFTNPKGYALNADRIHVGGSVHLRNNFTAQGTVRLVGATISGNLDCSGATFVKPNGNALHADSVRVNGSLLLGNGLVLKGRVILTNAVVQGYLQWYCVHHPKQSTVKLLSARVGTLWDDCKSWPAKLWLHEFQYDRLENDALNISVENRMKWLGLQYGPARDGFRAQPYEQLARTLRNAGYPHRASEVLIAKERDRLTYGNMQWYQQLGHRLLGFTIGYGYRPWQALWFCLVFIAVGAVAFGKGRHLAYVQPTSTGVLASKEAAENYPRFNALVYSLDEFLPLIKLHQAEYWTVTKGIWLRLYLWIHIIAGWTLSTLLAVGLSGLVTD